MPTFSFRFDWLEAERVRGPELSATWAALQIIAGDQPLTRVLDGRAKTVRDHIYVPLYPLAEWLATNWWFLNYECGNPVKEGTPEFRRRHGLATNREGYAFPDLEVISSGSQTQLSWKRDSLQWSRVEFLDEGKIWLDREDFQKSCRSFVDQVVRRLFAMDIEGTLLQEEWEAIQSADEEETKFCAAAARLGWHPYALSDAEQSSVLCYDEKLGQLLDETLPALSTVDLFENWQMIKGITKTIPQAQKFHSIPLDRLRSFASDVANISPANQKPRDVGYEAARRLRAHLNLKTSPFPTLKYLADALDEDHELLDKAVWPVDFLPQASMINGVVTRTHDGNPAFGLRQMGESQRTFHVCRAFSEILTHPASDALITRSYSERQQSNRAFAAEFLAPSAALQEMITHNVADNDTIDELAAVFGVSSRVIEHQLVNHGIARIPG